MNAYSAPLIAAPRQLPRTTLTLPGQRQAAQQRARQRLVIVMLLFIGFLILVAVRLSGLAMTATPLVAREAASDTPPRADIVDRNGVELARTIDAYAISVEPRNLATDPVRLAREISLVLPGRTAGQIEAELTSRASFRYIARRVLPSEAKRINDLGEPAIHLRREAERLYPNLNLAAHALGYADTDGRGQVGMERAVDQRLADPATRGTPVALSIDARVQQAVEHELGTLMIDQRAAGAAGIVLDVDTGEILALTSLPDFNPNAPGRGAATVAGEAAPPVGTGPLPKNMLNRTTYDVFELGSTVKALTIAMGLNAGTITSMDKLYDASRPLHIAGFRIHDDHALNRWLTVPEIFAHSSNIGTARIASELGRDRQRAYLGQLGFFDPIENELPERARPKFPPLSNWGEVATMTIGYGHGIAVSPLHLANAYATLVNGGIYRPTTLLKRAPGAAPPGRRVFTAATSDTMRALLRMVVTSGTGRKANAPGYRVGGKTGTAEKLGGGRYLKGANISTFAAAFPMDAPRYVVIAMVDDPRGSKATFGFKTAGMVVAPMMGRLIERIGPLLGVTPDRSRDVDVAGMLGLPDKAPVKAEE